jgi:hypothetical protein
MVPKPGASQSTSSPISGHRSHPPLVAVQSRRPVLATKSFTLGFPAGDPRRWTTDPAVGFRILLHWRSLLGTLDPLLVRWPGPSVSCSRSAVVSGMRVSIEQHWQEA